MTDHVLTLPALIDPHVHFREPGGEHKETLQTGAAAARAGGVHTVCDMPNTNPPTTSVEALTDKVRRAQTVDGTDIRFFFGITESAHIEELERLWTDKALADVSIHCCGVKLYLDHSTGNQKVAENLVDDVFCLCGVHDIPLVAHCEDPEINEVHSAQYSVHSSDVSTHSKRRPPESEASAIEYALTLTEKHSTPFHVAHLSTMQGVQLIRKAKKDGLTVSCEVTPHHLFLTTDDYKRLGTFGKMNPPLRAPEHREALWEGIADGTVDCVATDHAPHTAEEKQEAEDPLSAPSGVPGVETRLPLLLTVAAGKWPGEKLQTLSGSSYQLSGEDIERLCFENPNRIFRLGKDPRADRITIDPDAEWVIRGKNLHTKCGWSPFEGWTVRGKIIF